MAPDDSALAAQQRWLAGLILDAAPAGREGTDVSLLATTPPALARDRLGAYIGGYPVRIAEAMAEAYPAIRNIVGRAEFDALLARYRPMVPRGIYSLSEAGRNFPQMLAGDALTERLAFLPDLATLEWRVLTAFHAFVGPDFDIQAVAHWDMEDWSAATFEFQSGVAVMESEWPIVALWETRHSPRESIDVEMVGRPEAALVRREGFDVCCDVISRSEAALLRALAAGLSLGDATERLAEETEMDESSDIGAWLARWARQRLIASCRTAAR